MTQYYVDRVLKNGKRIPVKPGGKRFFGKGMLGWVRKRARRKKQTIIVGVVADPREKMRQWMNWALRNTASIHYAQSRPIPLKAGKAHKLPLTTDCSGSTTICAYSAGLPDPNGRKYNGTGYTGTLRDHCKEIKRSQLRVGDIIIYGRGTGTHVVIVYNITDTDIIVFSHGQESGPRLYTHSIQMAVHGSYCTYHTMVA